LVEQLFLIVEDCKRSIILFYYFVSFLNFPLLILFFPLFSLHPQQPHAPYRLHPSTARRTNPPQLFHGFASASSIDSVVSFFSRLPHLRTEPRRRPVPASANRAAAAAASSFTVCRNSLEALVRGIHVYAPAPRPGSWSKLLFLASLCAHLL